MTSIYYQNVRGLRTKLDEFQRNMSASGYPIVCLTETWLNDDFNDAEISGGEYLVFRKDRNYNLSNTVRGGGSLIAVSEGLICQRMSEMELSLDFLEDIWIRILLPNNSWLYVCCVYISPFNNNGYLYEALAAKAMDNFTQIDIADQILVVGDFNCPSINRFLDNTTDSRPTPNTEAIINLIEFGNLTQINNVSYNLLGSTLDLVFVSDDAVGRVSKSINVLLTEDVYHPAIEINIEALKLKKINQNIFKRNFFKANFSAINDVLSSQNWDSLLNLPLNEAVERFYLTVNASISDFVPQSNKKKSFPEWFTMELINLLREKDRFRNKFKKHGNQNDYAEFANRRNRCKALSERCYRNYLRDIQLNIPANIKKFWHFTKLKRKTNSYPLSMNNGQTDSINPVEVSEMFASFFESTYGPVDNRDITAPTFPTLHSGFMESIVTNETEVETFLSNVDANKRGGPDGIPNLYLKACAKTLAKPLSIIFNKSLELGDCPSIWKVSSLTPIHKQGDKSDVRNYRPISKQNVFMKLFEKIVHSKLSIHINCQISTKQHGFFPNRSIQTNLSKYTNFVAGKLENSSEVHAIYMDISKAFDRVNIQMLMLKLQRFGIRGRVWDWLKSYLVGRKQYVSFNGSRSHEFFPGTGVPQGSHLGPILFLCYINDLSYVVKSQLLMFADDAKIFRETKSALDCCALQNDIDAILKWAEVNFLSLNVQKCQSITFSNKRMPLSFQYKINGEPINSVTEVNDLGVLFDSKLSFRSHVLNIVKKAYRNLGFVMRTTKDFTNLNCIKFLFFSLVRNGIEFASQIWNPQWVTLNFELEKVQKKFTRFLIFKSRQPRMEYTERLNCFQMISLEQRRTLADLLFLYNLVHNIANVDFSDRIILQTQHYVMREPPSFRISNSRSNYGQHVDPINRILRAYNRSFRDVDVFGLTKGKFKSSIMAKFV